MLLHCAIRYYDGQLASDDEMVQISAGCRDVVLAPAPADAQAGTMPLPKSLGAASAGSSVTTAAAGQGVLLSRAFGEHKLYTQVSPATLMASWILPVHT